MAEYVELHCHSNFSFQEGASTIEELVERAVGLGYPALALTDHDNLSGALRFARKARRAGLHPITGAEVSLAGLAPTAPGADAQHHAGEARRSRDRGEILRSAQNDGTVGARNDGTNGSRRHGEGSAAIGSPNGWDSERPGGGLDRHLTLLAATDQGYRNLANLLSLSPFFSDRRKPELDPRLLPEHAQGLVLLTGCAHGPAPRALVEGRHAEAVRLVREYQEWFGGENVFIEVQQNLVRGDTRRVRLLAGLGREMGVPLVATNNAHYHVRDRHRLQDCMVAVRNRLSLEASHRERRANAEFSMRSATEMARLFHEIPDAVSNTLAVAERCTFDITAGLTYRFPDRPVPDGFDQVSYLEHLCREAAVRKYGAVTPAIETRLREELRRIRHHSLAGLLLMYHEIIGIAREVQVDLGLVDRETPLEESPPGRGRGSSVALLVGYLLGLSHIDPLQYDLGLDRFMPEELVAAPDIDLDFPRNIREELIKRVHAHYGWERAALTAAFPTYHIRGAIRDLGLALGLPAEQVDRLAKQTEHAPASGLRKEMLALPAFRDKADAPVWRDLIDLAAQLDGFPRGISQHPGGMVLSSTPLMDSVPIQQSAMEGRYVCQWDKHSVEDARFVKIDFLAIGALSQMQEALRLIEERTGERVDMSRIDFEDPAVYAMLHRADTIGIFQVESTAQIQTIPRLKPMNLVDMAYEVAAVRPGVGVNDGVTEFIRRRRAGIVRYDHPLEAPALERTRGIVLYQDQFNELAVHVSGFTPTEAEEFRRAHGRADEQEAVRTYWWPKFRDGALARGVDKPAIVRIFKKFNGQYMFPEAHAYAFGITAYQMAWLKHYYPLEFFVGLFNEQPMGFYNLETLKEDAKRCGVPVLHPDLNRSLDRAAPSADCAPPAQAVGAPRAAPNATIASLTEPSPERSREGDALRLGLLHVAGVGPAVAEAILREREARGPYASVADLMARAGLKREALDNLASAGALDGLAQSECPRQSIESGTAPLMQSGSDRPSGGPDRLASTRALDSMTGRTDALNPRTPAQQHDPGTPGRNVGFSPEAAKAAADPNTRMLRERRDVRWEVGLRYRPPSAQLSLGLPVEQDVPDLPRETAWEVMAGEYGTMGVHPGSHLMAYLRDSLPLVTTSADIWNVRNGVRVTVAGLVIRRQHPQADAYFLTLEDEFGHIPLAVWPQTYHRLRHVLKEPVLLVRGTVSHREGTMNVVVEEAEGIPVNGSNPPPSKNWR